MYSADHPRSKLINIPVKLCYSLQLYDNGYLGIGGGSPSKTPTVLPFKDSYGGLVAPYWADVDTTTHGAIFYRETEDSGDLADIATDIQGVYEGGFTPDSAVIVTWDAVGYCCLNSDPQVQLNIAHH